MSRNSKSMTYLAIRNPFAILFQGCPNGASLFYAKKDNEDM